MTTPTDTGLLGQILDTLGKLGERLAVVESDLKTVIRDHTKDLDDHETRLRRLEDTARDGVTRADLDAAEARRVESLHEALVESDRKANRRLTVASLALAGVIAAVNIVMSRIT